jgi:MFS family permease
MNEDTTTYASLRADGIPTSSMSTSAETCPTPMGKVVMASMAGATLEWYDFTLYNALAALVFNRLFFPTVGPLVGTILAFSTYAVGYVSRPIGGIIFGWAGDRFGRKLVYAAGIATGVIAAIAVFALFDSRQPIWIVIAVIFGFAAHAAMYGVQASLVTEQFDSQVRFAGSSLAYTFAGAIGGGFAPLIIATLYRRYTSPLPISLCVAGALAVSALALACSHSWEARPH